MGANPRASSRIVANERETPLHACIARDPVRWVGEKSARQFGAHLPFLLKLLAARTALSIQTHPTISQATAGYARENNAGLADDDAHRTYKDSNHKPELMIALAPFWAMCGFRQADEIDAAFSAPMFRSLRSMIGDDMSTPALFRGIVRAGSDRTDAARDILNELLPNIRNGYLADCQHTFALPTPPPTLNNALVPYWWVVKLSQCFPGDLTVLSPLYLNTFCLSPGEGLFIAPCTAHAYLYGHGIEIMANSDNVIRGGLTPKWIDIPELVRILNFEHGGFRRIMPTEHDGRRVFDTPAREFTIEQIVLSSRQHIPLPKAAKIMLAHDGDCHIKIAGASLTINQGESCFVTPAVAECVLTGDGALTLAACGV